MSASTVIAPTATLQEVFSSIQGEGPWVGLRQVFVRFNKCHLACAFCDAPAQAEHLPCKIHDIWAEGSPVLIDNPVSVARLYEVVSQYLGQLPHHSISLTGGEPLLYTPYLQAALPQLSQLAPIYLETSGTLPNQLEKVLPWVSMVAMDIKLPSATHQPINMAEHQACYALSKTKPYFVKLVFNQHTTLAELDAVREIVTDRDTCIVLQPETSLTTGGIEVSIAHMNKLHAYLNQFYADVRLIPQTHKQLGVV